MPDGVGPHLMAGHRPWLPTWSRIANIGEASVYIHVADREAQYKEVFAYDFSGWSQLMCVDG